MYRQDSYVKGEDFLVAVVDVFGDEESFDP